jgi:hypothetical protein
MWQMKSNVTQGVVFRSPKDLDERGQVAESCVRKLNIKLPALLDTFDNSTEQAYTGWPDRLYVIDREGKVAQKSGAGPFGFRPAEMEAKLRELVD